jgi:aminoglycoside phosphotransferase (APT) family kinase protein
MPQPLERDLDDTRRRLLDWFARKLPDASGFAIDGLRGPSATGFSSDTLLFDLSFREGGTTRTESLVARIEPAGAFPIFPSYDVALQYKTMQAMGEQGVPVPRMRWLEEDRAALGAPFYVMDCVDGLVPNDNPPYHQGGWVFDLAPEQRSQVWWSGLESMARVHRVDWRDPAFAFLPQPESSVAPIEHELGYYDDFLAWGTDRSKLPLVERALAWLRANAPRDEPIGICWGDSRLANQIFREGRCVAVIDWEMVFLGNPVSDLAWWITMDRCFSEGIGLERAPGIPGCDETVARWEELLGRKAEHYAFYAIFAAFRFAVIMARIGRQMKYYEIVPADNTFESSNLGSAVLATLLEVEGVR